MKIIILPRMGFKDHTQYCNKCNMETVGIRGEIRFCDCDFKFVTTKIPKFKIPKMMLTLNNLKPVEIELETLLLIDFEGLINKDRR